MDELLESVYGEEILSQQSQLSVVALASDEDDKCDSDNEAFIVLYFIVLAAMLEGILLPSNMAAKTTFCLYLVKRLIVTLRCPVNVTTSSFQHFP